MFKPWFKSHHEPLRWYHILLTTLVNLKANLLLRDYLPILKLFLLCIILPLLYIANLLFSVNNLCLLFQNFHYQKLLWTLIQQTFSQLLLGSVETCLRISPLFLGSICNGSVNPFISRFFNLRNYGLTMPIIWWIKKMFNKWTKEKYVQQMTLEQLNIHIEKNKLWPLPYILCKN